MPLESVMVCLDNSEWMRNGDCSPSRLDAQYDAAFLVCNAKMQENPENSVGSLTHGGDSVAVKTSPSEDTSKVLASLHGIQCRGNPHFGNAIRVAMLALKHRKNKHGGQRIVIFIGSPIQEEEKQLKKIGAMLRKNNIALDIIAMGENEKNEDKLRKINEAVNNNDNSHIVYVTPGVLPSEALMSSPILPAGVGASMPAGGGPAGGQDLSAYGGVDPNVDPELAQAIRLSLEESRAQTEEQDRSESVPPSASGVEASHGSSAQPDTNMTSGSTQQTQVPPQTGVEDENEMLERAIAMSMMENEQAASSTSESHDQTNPQFVQRESASRSTPQTATAGLNLQAPGAQSTATSSTTPSGTSASTTFQDPNFVSELLGGLPGVDVNDPNIQAALRQINNQRNHNQENQDNQSNDGHNEGGSSGNGEDSSKK